MSYCFYFKKIPLTITTERHSLFQKLDQGIPHLVSQYQSVCSSFLLGNKCVVVLKLLGKMFPFKACSTHSQINLSGSLNWLLGGIIAINCKDQHGMALCIARHNPKYIWYHWIFLETPSQLITEEQEEVEEKQEEEKEKKQLVNVVDCGQKTVFCKVHRFIYMHILINNILTASMIFDVL